MASKKNDGRTSRQLSEQKLCENGCGFYGSPATMNLCSKCFREFLAQQLEAQNLHTPISSDQEETSVGVSVDAETYEDQRRPPSGRCMHCKKKVRLNGFDCKCGGTFCVIHRFPEEHDCTFDVKKVGREMIGKFNPLVQADKIQRI